MNPAADAPAGLRPGRVRAWLGLAAFALSGFAALSYIAVWARYLGTVLGSSSQAQNLTLGLCLAGLAGGAVLAARNTGRVTSPLVLFAALHGLLALAAVYFHDVFLLVRTLLEGGGSASWPSTRWLLGPALTLPLAVMLGATFPLMAAALRSADGHEAGASAQLHLAFGLGGAGGAVATGLLLVHTLGLLGSQLVAAVAGAAAALIAWVLHHRTSDPPPARPGPPLAEAKTKMPRFSALATGLLLAVFALVWTRQIVLLLGSPSAAFAATLAPVVAGLAFGSYAATGLRKSGAVPVVALSPSLLAASVLLALHAYPFMFGILETVKSGASVSAAGYAAYRLACAGLSFLFAGVPAFCAGAFLSRMAFGSESSPRLLPGEAALAWSVLGALIGIALAPPLMGFMGLQGTLTVMAFLALGTVLINDLKLAVAGAVGAVILVLTAAEFGPWSPNYNPNLLMSGVYMGNSQAQNKPQPLEFVRHGPNSSVGLGFYEGRQGTSVATYANGKRSGAAPLEHGYFVDQDPGSGLSPVMLAALPLLHHPDAKNAAVLGSNTAYTPAALLRSATLENLVTIEAEPMAIDAAMQSGAGEEVFADRRSQVVAADYRSYFADKSGQFDVIVIADSPPWASGQATAYSSEHFAALGRALSPDGLLVLWFHLSQSNPETVASLMTALEDTFPEYVLYSMQNDDVAVVASQDAARIDSYATDMSGLEGILAEYDVGSPADLRAMAMGDQTVFAPYFASFETLPNSDYFPVLEYHAGLGLFTNSRYVLLDSMAQFGFAYNHDVMGGRQLREPFQKVSPSRFNRLQHSVSVLQVLLDDELTLEQALLSLADASGGNADDAESVRSLFAGGCDLSRDDALASLGELADIQRSVIVAALPSERRAAWSRIENEWPCFAELKGFPDIALLIDFNQAFAVGENAEVVDLGSEMLGTSQALASRGEIDVLGKKMLAHIALGDPNEALNDSFQLSPQASPQASHAIRMIGVHALGQNTATEDLPQ